MEKKKNIILHLSLISGVGPELLKYMTRDYSRDLNEEIYSLSQKDIMGTFSLTQKKSEMIFFGLRDKSLFEKELELMSQKKINFLTPFEEDYPQLLRVNSFFPGVIYFQNKEKILGINKALPLSIVSSRRTDRYGKKVIFDMIKGLSLLQNHNLVILSGGAIGGDTYAHEAALEYKIRTGAILGSGLLSLYPKVNTRLFETIIEEGGTLISHFSLNTPPSPTTFPARNALIAGLSKATLVVQAGQKSGTLITANYALEYGRNVGTIPGRIDDPLMTESNNLLKQGAACITNAQDLFDLLEIDSSTLIVKNDFSVSERYNSCSVLQQKIISLCSIPRSLEELADELDISSSLVYEDIIYLIGKQYIKEDILGCFYRA